MKKLGSFGITELIFHGDWYNYLYDAFEKDENIEWLITAKYDIERFLNLEKEETTKQKEKAKTKEESL